MVKELLDENAFDNQRLFNGKEFSTLIVNREGFSKKENQAADLIESILDRQSDRPQIEEAFKRLKATGASDLLVRAIREARSDEDKARLTAAAWECGLDFSAHFRFFAGLVSHDDFQLALEALSVVENIEKASHAEVQAAIIEAKNSRARHADLVSDLLHNLNSRLND